MKKIILAVIITFLCSSQNLVYGNIQERKQAIYKHEISQLKQIKSNYEKMLQDAQENQKQAIHAALLNINTTINMFKNKKSSL